MVKEEFFLIFFILNLKTVLLIQKGYRLLLKVKIGKLTDTVQIYRIYYITE
jgi:hypothetical protein